MHINKKVVVIFFLLFTVNIAQAQYVLNYKCSATKLTFESGSPSNFEEVFFEQGTRPLVEYSQNMLNFKDKPLILDITSRPVSFSVKMNGIDYKINNSLSLILTTPKNVRKNSKYGICQFSSSLVTNPDLSSDERPLSITSSSFGSQTTVTNKAGKNLIDCSQFSIGKSQPLDVNHSNTIIDNEREWLIFGCQFSID